VTDAEFLDAVVRGTPPGGAFGHRDHLRVAWLVVRREPGPDAATHRVRAAIRAVAGAAGQPDRYHETITAFWVRIVDHAVRARPDLDRFEAFLDAFPFLLDARSPFRHWRRETLLAEAARNAWVEPDLVRLPPR
jgi:hypothetical protein